VQFGAGLPVVFLYTVCEFLENPCCQRLTFLKDINVLSLFSINFIPFGSLSAREVPTNISRMIVGVIERG